MDHSLVRMMFQNKETDNKNLSWMDTALNLERTSPGSKGFLTGKSLLGIMTKIKSYLFYSHTWKERLQFFLKKIIQIKIN